MLLPGPSFASALAALLALFLGCLVTKWKEPLSSVRTIGKQVCLCLSFAASLSVSLVSVWVTWGTDRLGSGPSSTPQHSGWEAGSSMGWLSREQSEYQFNKKEMYIMETKYKMASFHLFLFLQNLPENPPAFPGSIFQERHVSLALPCRTSGFVLKRLIYCVPY